MPDTYSLMDHILKCPHDTENLGPIGFSRDDRLIQAARIGHSKKRISLIGGCHADEPIGPHLLRKLVNFLAELKTDHPLMQYEWWIIPHINPDGEAINRSWYDEDCQYTIANYLRHVKRELPGDDIEFGFPISQEEASRARPEALAAINWWNTSENEFVLHASMHGMGFSGGPWFLIDKDWISRSTHMQNVCSTTSKTLGYSLHDIERHGEKGFQRIARGFCTRPDSISMREHFMQLNDHEMADKFLPSSMQWIRSYSPEALTMVSEMPLFIIPGVGNEIDPDPAYNQWKENLADLQLKLATTDISEPEINEWAADLGIKAMDLEDQMRLQWAMICSGLEQLHC
ncbi:MAG: peptidase [Lentisphaeria bacterium]|nr:peptidase [Lentisphaeria bacterium]